MTDPHPERKAHDNSSGLLDLIYESLQPEKGLPHSETGKLTTPSYRNLEGVIGSAPFNAWLLNDAKISDDSIYATTTRLTTGPIDPAIVGYFDRNIEYSNAGSLYLRIIKSLCREIRMDTKNNRGEKFRWIVKNTQLGGINDVISNPEIKDWLFDHSEPTVYDLEDAIVKATILHMAAQYTTIIKDQDVPRSPN